MVLEFRVKVGICLRLFQGCLAKMMQIHGWEGQKLKCKFKETSQP